jgi:hypothetical protein
MWPSPGGWPEPKKVAAGTTKWPRASQSGRGHHKVVAGITKWPRAPQSGRGHHKVAAGILPAESACHSALFSLPPGLDEQDARRHPCPFSTSKMLTATCGYTCKPAVTHRP